MNVATEDNIYVEQSANLEYSIFQFKNQHSNDTGRPIITWIGRSNLAPSSSTVYLQIYNRTTSLWETLTSNNSAGADTKFTLTATVSGTLSDYYDVSNWISYRVYQLSI